MRMASSVANDRSIAVRTAVGGKESMIRVPAEAAAQSLSKLDGREAATYAARELDWHEDERFADDLRFELADNPGAGATTEEKLSDPQLDPQGPSSHARSPRASSGIGAPGSTAAPKPMQRPPA